MAVFQSVGGKKSCTVISWHNKKIEVTKNNRCGFCLVVAPVPHLSRYLKISFNDL
jgi:hypothetical protein